MSKYKYTSLLSSQYRQVFKSYHSLDRTEQELKDNLNKSLHKRIQTEVTQIQTKNHQLHFQKQGCAQAVQRPQTYLYYKSQPKYERTLTQPANNYQSTLGKQPKLQRASLNRLHTIETQHEFYPKPECPYTHSDNKKTRQNYHTISSNYTKCELKNKASQINKRRNDIKLNARVKDIHKINKKYDYLTEPNQIQENNQSVEPIRSFQTNQSVEPNRTVTIKTTESSPSPSLMISSKQSELRRSQTEKFTSSRELSNYSLDQNGKIQRDFSKFQSKQCIPLLETNSNKLHMMKVKYSKQASKQVSHKPNDEENIQTPHFHQTQAKKASIQPSLISLKLQSLVKNTYTDRF